MTNSKSIRQALISSALAVLMCVSMLIGTTFAWFTDTASTGVNKIVAGNLDIELSYKNSTTETFKKADKDTPVFKEGALWEPGHVEYAVLKVSNAGSLALKYRLGINIANEVGSTNVSGDAFKLSDYIRFAVLDGDRTEGDFDRDTLVTAAGEGAVLNKGYTAEDHMLSGDTKVVTLVVWMPTDVGNEANHMTDKPAPSIEFGISVAATQYTYESDSFDDQYDKNAQYPEVAYAQASTQEELDAALANPTDANGNPTTKVAVELNKDGAYTLPELTGKDVTVIGTKDTVVDMEGKVNKASSVSFEGVTVAFSNETYKGFQHTGKLTYKDCTITGMQVLYAKDAAFVNCTFIQGASDKYNAQVYGSTNVTFANCHFYGTNKNVYIYQETLDSDKNVTFNNCDFHMSATEDLKSAVMLNAPMNYAGYKYNVAINGCTEEGANTTAAANEAGNTNYQGLYGLKHKDGNGNSKIIEGTVTVDGTVVYSK